VDSLFRPAFPLLKESYAPAAFHTPHSAEAQAVALTGSDTIQAVAIVPANGGYTESPITLGLYDTTNPPPATPVLSPAGGTFIGPQPVSITDTTAGVILYYSINGGSPLKYNGAITVGVNETIQAVAIGNFGASYSESAVASGSFTILP
jgi:hypothetical protein